MPLVILAKRPRQGKYGQLTQLQLSEQYCPRLISRFFLANTPVFSHALPPIPTTLREGVLPSAAATCTRRGHITHTSGPSEPGRPVALRSATRAGKTIGNLGTVFDVNSVPVLESLLDLVLLLVSENFREFSEHWGILYCLVSDLGT